MEFLPGWQGSSKETECCDGKGILQKGDLAALGREKQAQAGPGRQGAAGFCQVRHVPVPEDWQRVDWVAV